MRIVEAWGTGMPRIINRCKEYGLPEPAFEEFGDGFKVTMFRKVSNTLGKVSNTFDNYLPLFKEAEITTKFVENIGYIFKEVGVDKPFGQANIMRCLGGAKSKATNIMNAMKAAKVIEKVTGLGAGKYKFTKL